MACQPDGMHSAGFARKCSVPARSPVSGGASPVTGSIPDVLSAGSDER